MRAPKRKRPRHRTMGLPPDGVELAEVASRADYVGSAEHKSYPSFAGSPALRSDASRCDPALADRDELTEWLRSSIRSGNVSEQWEGEWPRYVWHRQGEECYEARLVNQGRGQYKGYPLAPEEWPRGVT